MMHDDLPATIERFYRQHRKELYSYALALTRNPEAGMVMKVTVRSLDEPASSGNLVDLDYSIKTTFLVGRVSYPDVDLDIGKPIFETREAQTRLRVRLNQWMLLQSITAKDGPNGDTTLLIVMMRILEKTP
jgi:hypothetical protein